LRQCLWSKKDILTSLIDKNWQQFLPGIQVPYLRDVYDHVVIMLQQLESAAELLASLQGTYLSNVSIEVAEASNGVNVQMKMLSGVATIIMPLAFITGLMGMNIRIPFQTYDGEDPVLGLIPFICLVICMLIASITLVRLFKRHHYLE